MTRQLAVNMGACALLLIALAWRRGGWALALACYIAGAILAPRRS